MLSEKEILFVLIGWKCLKCFWENYLFYRQINVCLDNSTMPKELADYNFPSNEYETSRQLMLQNLRLAFYINSYTTIVYIYFTLKQGYGRTWRLLGDLLNYAGFGLGHEALRTVLYLVLQNCFNVTCQVPLDLVILFYSSGEVPQDTPSLFVCQMLGNYVCDRIFQILAYTIVTTPLVCLALIFLNICGSYFIVLLWATAVFAWASQNISLSPREGSRPLEVGPLRTNIQELLSSVKCPVEEIYVQPIDVAPYQNQLVSFTGLSTPRHLLLHLHSIRSFYLHDDENCNDCVVAMVAHEVSHWKLQHVVFASLLLQLNLVVIFLMFWMFSNSDLLYNAVGFGKERPMLVGLDLVYVLIGRPYETIAVNLYNVLYQQWESDADEMAVLYGYGEHLKVALVQVQAASRRFPMCDRLFNLFRHQSPPLLDRLRAIDKAIQHSSREQLHSKCHATTRMPSSREPFTPRRTVSGQ